jgi:hypothetical protein
VARCRITGVRRKARRIEEAAASVRATPAASVAGRELRRRARRGGAKWVKRP